MLPQHSLYFFIFCFWLSQVFGVKLGGCFGKWVVGLSIKSNCPTFVGRIISWHKKGVLHFLSGSIYICHCISDGSEMKSWSEMKQVTAWLHRGQEIRWHRRWLLDKTPGMNVEWHLKGWQKMINDHCFCWKPSKHQPMINCCHFWTSLCKGRILWFYRAYPMPSPGSWPHRLDFALECLNKRHVNVLFGISDWRQGSRGLSNRRKMTVIAFDVWTCWCEICK